VVEADRDGLVRQPVLDRLDQLYAHSGAAAYRAAAEIVGDGAGAADIVAAAFRETRETLQAGWSIDRVGAAVVTAVRRLAQEASAADGSQAAREGADPTPSPWAGTSMVRRGARIGLSEPAVHNLLSSQREVLELAVLEDLKVGAIAERTRTTRTEVSHQLRDGILALRSASKPSAADTLRRWRAEEAARARLSLKDPTRPAQTAAVAHAWLDYQVATHAIPTGTVVLITDSDRRFVATNAGAGALMGRGSVVGLHIDDVTASYARPLVPELWGIFDASGEMHGDYDCDRPGLDPVRVPFQGVWGRPAPDLQVGLLGAPAVAGS
jgi:DNA-directed RNA polymerase specialized sigma24 family protein